ncbi:PRICKLE2 [Cordylochernes scorpioides]|uniref:PRICKLE2 n=1 Tax=Cordylochernes scorpioides TaxID=51811 RepID=A0ABY6K9R7_9ARAC|nr:PRICKLE2 [Cordylochernes scorpioides]
MCVQCCEEIPGGDVAVTAGPLRWHPACFTCRTCGELLVDLTAFLRPPDLLCGRHHAETLRPRCNACDQIDPTLTHQSCVQLIFSATCTEAEGRTWHVHHFACRECGRQLGGGRYVPPPAGETAPLCLPCYEQRHAELCAACGDPITADCPRLAGPDSQHWHADCFRCHACRVPLGSRPVLARHGVVFCSSTCALRPPGKFFLSSSWTSLWNERSGRPSASRMSSSFPSHPASYYNGAGKVVVQFNGYLVQKN